MRHLKQKATLGRESAQRYALMRSLAESLILHGGVKTTSARARALRQFVEPLVTKAKVNSLAVRRQLGAVLYTDEVINKLMREIGPKFADRNGGYTRITKIGTRPNDAAPVVRIEFV